MLSRLLYVLFRDPASFSDCAFMISLGFDGRGYLGVANDGSWSTIARAEAIKKKGQRMSLPLNVLNIRPQLPTSNTQNVRAGSVASRTHSTACRKAFPCHN